MKVHVLTIFCKPREASTVITMKAVFSDERRAEAFEAFNIAAGWVGDKSEALATPWIVNGDGGKMAGLPAAAKLAVDPSTIVGVICESPDVQMVQSGAGLFAP